MAGKFVYGYDEWSFIIFYKKYFNLLKMKNSLEKSSNTGLRVFTFRYFDSFWKLLFFLN